ncbi:MAG: hypothetical protein KDK51_09995, partial [Deltaproteobacteria bacterium]|nr:hypothetical protein [Deltaproteobacteria bacterium]
MPWFRYIVLVAIGIFFSIQSSLAKTLVLSTRDYDGGFVAKTTLQKRLRQLNKLATDSDDQVLIASTDPKSQALAQTYQALQVFSSQLETQWIRDIAVGWSPTWHQFWMHSDAITKTFGQDLHQKMYGASWQNQIEDSLHIQGGEVVSSPDGHICIAHHMIDSKQAAMNDILGCNTWITLPPMPSPYTHVNDHIDLWVGFVGPQQVVLADIVPEQCKKRADF